MKITKIAKWNLSIIVLILLIGCEWIEYHPYDTHIDGTVEINAKNIARIEALYKDKETIRFAMMGDSQRWYDETKDFVNHINQRNDVNFVIHGGDITDFGLTKEFKWMREIMNGLTIPYVVLLGNHDVLGHGLSVYREMFGPENFSFIAGRTKFLCLNTCALEFDYSDPVPDFTFIRDEMTNDTASFDKTIPVMHIPPHADEFNHNVSSIFEEYLKRFQDLQFCLYAHMHNLNAHMPFEDGVMYYGCSCMKDRNYLLLTLTPEGYHYEVVDF